VSLALFLAARQVSLFPDRSARLASFLEMLSLPFAVIAALALTDAVAPYLVNGLDVTLFAVAYSTLALDVLRRTASNFLRKSIGVSISLAVAVSFTLSVANDPTALTALLALVAGVMLILWGAAGRKPIAMFCGLVTSAAGVIFGFDDIVQLIIRSSWIDLAIFGATAVALGSVVDRHGVAIKLRLHKWFNAVNEQQESVALES